MKITPIVELLYRFSRIEGWMDCAEKVDAYLKPHCKINYESVLLCYFELQFEAERLGITMKEIKA